jgi:hypothetical protein
MDIVGVAALVVVFISIRIQILILIEEILSRKAKEANEALDRRNNEIKMPKLYSNASNIFSSIVTAEEILYSYTRKSYYRLLLIRFDEPLLLNTFYLNLNTSIRVELSKSQDVPYYDLTEAEHLSKELPLLINQQVIRSKVFLKKQINKNSKKEFEKLHAYSK